MIGCRAGLSLRFRLGEARISLPVLLQLLYIRIKRLEQILVHVEPLGRASRSAREIQANPFSAISA